MNICQKKVHKALEDLVHSDSTGDEDWPHVFLYKHKETLRSALRYAKELDGEVIKNLREDIQRLQHYSFHVDVVKDMADKMLIDFDKIFEQKT